MRTIAVLLMLALATVAGSAQSNPVDRLFEKYAGQEGFTSVYISSHMFSLFAGMDKGDKEFDDIFGKLTGIRILTTDERIHGINFYDELAGELPLDHYEELMVIHEKDQNVKFLINEKDGVISELLMISGGIDDNALISIRGRIDLKTISGLSQSMKIKGLENLEKVEEKKE